MKYFSLIKEAWKDYDNSRKILSITDISIKVSTNHVYRIILKDGSKIIVKISDLIENNLIKQTDYKHFFQENFNPLYGKSPSTN